MYAARDNIASARQAAAIWADRLAKDSGDFEAAWKLARARYWLGGHPERTWTSVSFLIDRGGVIRWFHGGGEYHASTDPRHASCDLEYRELEQAVRAALAETVP